MILNNTQALIAPLQQTVEKLISEFDLISDERKKALHVLTDYIGKREGPVVLNFICTHNARRSHISQIWAQAAAHYYRVDSVRCLSGGTEVTCFHPNAVRAIMKAGFEIEREENGPDPGNPIYLVKYANEVVPLKAFSKRFDDPFNSADEFAAVMVCSDADAKCPVIPHASQRIPLRFRDPKEFDGTPMEEKGYSDRALEIGRELLYVFSKVKVK